LKLPAGHQQQATREIALQNLASLMLYPPSGGHKLRVKSSALPANLAPRLFEEERKAKRHIYPALCKSIVMRHKATIQTKSYLARAALSGAPTGETFSWSCCGFSTNPAK
jgi:hypothetical protein